jgi:DNA repair photolyase
MSILFTPEWPYCAYPLVVDIYNFCFHDCLYCFTKHKETWHNKAKKRKARGFKEDLDILNIDRFKSIFSGEDVQKRTHFELKTFLEQRYAIQIGAQTDPAGLLETKYGRTLQLLKLLKTKGNCYPVRISTKGIAFKDEEYLEVFRDYRAASILISINSIDSGLVKKVEPHAPSIEERFSLARLLSRTKAQLGLRLRPILPMVTERTIEELIREAKECGFQWVTVEWLRIPRTLTNESLVNFNRISDAIGVNLIEYYKRYSDIEDNNNGYLRLKSEYTIKLYEKIYSLCEKNGLKLASCNKDFRCYKTYSPNCCGAPLSDSSWNRMQFSYAVYIAKEKGKVFLRDVFDLTSPLNAVRNNDNDSKRYYNLSYGETFKQIWNNSSHRYYPARFFPELAFYSKDADGNHIFSYRMPFCE